MDYFTHPLIDHDACFYFIQCPAEVFRADWQDLTSGWDQITILIRT